MGQLSVADSAAISEKTETRYKSKNKTLKKEVIN